jgi:hypothetical protein
MHRRGANLPFRKLTISAKQQCEIKKAAHHTGAYIVAWPIDFDNRLNDGLSGVPKFSCEFKTKKFGRTYRRDLTRQR